MKGIVFIELHKLIENTWGPEYLEELIDKVELESGGIYTGVGYYDSAEVVALVTQISKDKNIPANDLVKIFGQHMGNFFIEHHNHYFAEAGNTFELLKSIDNHIHVDVKKIHADADLPTFSFEQVDDNTLILTYRSKRDMATLAEGLIEATATHYNENVTIERERIDDPQMNCEKFTVVRK